MMLLNEITKPIKELSKQGKSFGSFDLKYGNASKAQMHLMSKGYKTLGVGFYARTFEMPGHPDKVVKVSHGDECSLHFLNWAKKHPSPNVPKIYDLKVFDPLTKSYYCVMEKLEPISANEFNKNGIHVRRMLSYFRYFILEPNNKGPYKEKMLDSLKAMSHEMRKRTMTMIQAMMRMYKTFQNTCKFDLHDENVMYRPSTGDLVVIDPFARDNNKTQRFGKTKEEFDADLAKKKP